MIKALVKPILLVFSLFALTFNSFAQMQADVEPIDKVIKAINAKDVEILKPYISSETKASNLPAVYTMQILTQAMAKLGKVESVQLARKEETGENTRYFYKFKINGEEKEFDFLISPKNIFLEINIVKVEVQGAGNHSNIENAVYPSQIEIPFRLADKHIVVEAEIDGRKGNFLFDSGAPTLFLNKNHFNNQNNPATMASAAGVSGAINNISRFKAKSFNWAGISFKDKEFPAMDISHLEKASNEKEILGLIGYSIFQKYAVTFDYKNKKLLLALTNSDIHTSEKPFFSSPIKMFGHLPLIEMQIEGKTYKFAIDAGAGKNLLDLKYEGELSKHLKNVDKGSLIGADNKPQVVTRGILKESILQNKVVFKNMATVFSDISHFNGRNHNNSSSSDSDVIDGILGYEFLSQYKTTIDFNNKTISFYK